jgi:hypothetical protein
LQVLAAGIPSHGWPSAALRTGEFEYTSDQFGDFQNIIVDGASK